MQKPMYDLNENVGTCIFHQTFVAFVTLMAACAWPMIAA